jgi:hypothetical protein
MRCRLSIGFATLILGLALVILHATPAGARNRSRYTRRRAWCETPHDRRDESYGTLGTHRHRKASKDCCAAVPFQWAYFSEFFGECHSQNGWNDRGIDWYNFKRCCEERLDAGMAASDEYFFDDLDMEEEAHGFTPPQGPRWREYIGLG